jgi:hypothetical protein
LNHATENAQGALSPPAPLASFIPWYDVRMKKKKKLAQVRIYETDRDWFALEATRRRTTIAEVIADLRQKRVTADRTKVKSVT